MDGSTDASDFLHREVPAFGKRVHRLGLAGNYGLDEAGIRYALERGLNYVFWSPIRSGALTRALRSLSASERDKLVIATGPLLAYSGGAVRRRLERVLQVLKTDHLDVMQLLWLGVTASWSEGTLGELVKLREEGKVRAIGISIHDRERAGRLAEDSPLDMLMIRYNAAHPGAERDIFPHLARRKPAVVAYTATARRRLLHPPRGWTGRVPTAGDCYRFCLSSPHVDVVLTGPSNRLQLDANLAAVERGPLSPDELQELRAYGKAVHG